MPVLLVVLVVVTLALGACGSPTDVVIPTDKSAWDKDVAPAMKKLSEQDQALVLSYVVRKELGAGLDAIFGGSSSPEQGLRAGVTIGHAIAEQKQWLAEQEAREKEQAALRQKMDEEAKASRATIDSALTVAVLSLKFLPSDFVSGRYLDQLVAEVAFKNKGDKAIEGVQGAIAFIDIFGKEVGSIGFGITETIAPGTTFRWNGARNFNEFDAQDQAMRELKQDKYKTEFRPKKIVFSDGTAVALP